MTTTYCRPEMAIWRDFLTPSMRWALGASKSDAAHFSALSRAITFHQTIPGRSPGIGIASKLRHPEQLHQDAQP
jgi:hypothetical protein